MPGRAWVSRFFLYTRSACLLFFRYVSFASVAGIPVCGAFRCADETARGGVSAMESQLPHNLRLAEREDRVQWKRVIDQVLEWDEETPYSYDHRWINLHGIGAYRNVFPELENKWGGRKLEALSLPEDQWPELRKKVREDFRQAFEEGNSQIPR